MQLIFKRHQSRKGWFVLGQTSAGAIMMMPEWLGSAVYIALLLLIICLSNITPWAFGLWIPLTAVYFFYDLCCQEPAWSKGKEQL